MASSAVPVLVPNRGNTAQDDFIDPIRRLNDIATSLSAVDPYRNFLSNFQAIQKALGDRQRNIFQHPALLPSTLHVYVTAELLHTTSRKARFARRLAKSAWSLNTTVFLTSFGPEPASSERFLGNLAVLSETNVPWDIALQAMQDAQKQKLASRTLRSSSKSWTPKHIMIATEHLRSLGYRPPARQRRKTPGKPAGGGTLREKDATDEASETDRRVGSLSPSEEGHDARPTLINPAGDELTTADADNDELQDDAASASPGPPADPFDTDDGMYDDNSVETSRGHQFVLPLSSSPAFSSLLRSSPLQQGISTNNITFRRSQHSQAALQLHSLQSGHDESMGEGNLGSVTVDLLNLATTTEFTNARELEPSPSQLPHDGQDHRRRCASASSDAPLNVDTEMREPQATASPSSDDVSPVPPRTANISRQRAPCVSQQSAIPFPKILALHAHHEGWNRHDTSVNQARTSNATIPTTSRPARLQLGTLSPTGPTMTVDLEHGITADNWLTSTTITNVLEMVVGRSRHYDPGCFPEQATEETIQSWKLSSPGSALQHDINTMIYVPISLDGSHWVLLQVDPARHRATFFNSMRSFSRPKSFLAIARRIVEHLFGSNRWTAQDWQMTENNQLQQDNGIDCGIIAMFIATINAARPLPDLPSLPDSLNGLLWRQILSSLTDFRPADVTLLDAFDQPPGEACDIQLARDIISDLIMSIEDSIETLDTAKTAFLDLCSAWTAAHDALSCTDQPRVQQERKRIEQFLAADTAEGNRIDKALKHEKTRMERLRGVEHSLSKLLWRMRYKAG